MIAVLRASFFHKVVPTLFLLFVIVLERWEYKSKSVLYGELGWIENIQASLLLLAFVLSVRLFRSGIKVDQSLWRKWFLFLAVIGSLYAFLEEISYGQHYFQWNTPAMWAEYNDQSETNLHNTLGLFDQLPKLLLQFFIIGIGFMSVLIKYKPEVLSDRLKLLIPKSGFFFLTMIIIFLKIYGKAPSLWDLPVYPYNGELQELYFYYFVLLYLVFLNKKLLVGSNV